MKECARGGRESFMWEPEDQNSEQVFAFNMFLNMF